MPVRRSMMTLIAALLPSVSGCAMRIVPPSQVSDAETVFVADYGYHASLLLPTGSGELAEFAYGQYDWFALNRDQWYHAIKLALWPHTGALGTRTLPGPPTADALSAKLVVETLHPIRVERGAAARVLARLEAMYEEQKRKRGEVYNSSVRLLFVEHPRDYWHDYNCNVALAEWLEWLGCRVSGSRSSAMFTFEQEPVVKPPEPPGAEVDG